MTRLRATAGLLALALLSAACGSLPFLDRPAAVRRVLVDYKHDEFGGSFLNYFPRKVQVRAGDTVEFRQLWTGEAHTVTMGTLVDTLGKPYWDLLDARAAGKKTEVPEEAPAAPGFDKLPVLLDATFENVVQTAAQPCYRDTWVPDVRDVDGACPKRTQPKFNGRQAYYNSGFIPFEGPGNNRFAVPLADDILPGTYHYYCNYHGVAMSGAIEVVDDDESIPDQAAVNHAAREEAEYYIDVLAKVIERQRAGKDAAALPVVGGYPGPEDTPDDPLFTAFHNEFVPATVEARVGERVTWSFYGGHTLSFNVPKYFPVFTVAENGAVSFNPAAFKPVGWPERPEGESAVHIDVGGWDGTGGLHSTGWDYGRSSRGPTFDTVSITFTQPGTYPFACLLHPTMVGKVVVR